MLWLEAGNGFYFPPFSNYARHFDHRNVVRLANFGEEYLAFISRFIPDDPPGFNRVERDLRAVDIVAGAGEGDARNIDRYVQRPALSLLNEGVYELRLEAVLKCTGGGFFGTAPKLVKRISRAGCQNLVGSLGPDFLKISLAGRLGVGRRRFDGRLWGRGGIAAAEGQTSYYR